MFAQAPKKKELNMLASLFHFVDAKIHNELPAEIRKAESFNDFIKLLKKHFS